MNGYAIYNVNYVWWMGMLYIHYVYEWVLLYIIIIMYDE